MKIENLKFYPRCIPKVASWHFEEWHELYPEKTLSDFEEDLVESLGEGCIPQTWILFDEGEICGTASLLKHDMPTNQDLSPWLANIYIRKSKRGMGGGKQLVQSVMEAVGRLNIPEFFLFTEDQQIFYEKLGWVLVKKENFSGKMVSIMRFVF